jgi:hypothetical protein
MVHGLSHITFKGTYRCQSYTLHRINSASKSDDDTRLHNGRNRKWRICEMCSPDTFYSTNISNNADFCDSPSFSIVDAKNRAISVSYNESTGEFESYNYSNNIVSGASFIDSNLDGQYDAKVGPGKSVALYYNSKWFPMIIKDKKKYLEIDGMQKEIEMKDFRWKFAGQ